MASSGWSCFSNRVLASVRSPSRPDVRRMFVPTQVAASISTRVVPEETSATWPPMTPAIPEGPSPSHTSAASLVNVRSTPSSVVIVSPSRARRTTMRPPRTRSRSKACRGCAVTSIT